MFLSIEHVGVEGAVEIEHDLGHGLHAGQARVLVWRDDIMHRCTVVVDGRWQLVVIGAGVNAVIAFSGSISIRTTNTTTSALVSRRITHTAGCIIRHAPLSYELGTLLLGTVTCGSERNDVIHIGVVVVCARATMVLGPRKLDPYLDRGDDCS
jgi:hypothetical protein